jgi:DNA-binding GntR family transcriptional regulator
MTRLVNEGALRNVDGRGFRTVRLDREQYREIVRIRIALEPMTAGLAVARIGDAQIAALHNRNESLSNAIAREDFKAALEIDTDFHLALYEIAGQPLLTSMITSLLLRAGPTRTRLSGKYRKSRIGIAHHRDLLEALRARDADAASLAVAADLRDGSNAILSELAP